MTDAHVSPIPSRYAASVGAGVALPEGPADGVLGASFGTAPGVGEGTIPFPGGGVGAGVGATVGDGITVGDGDGAGVAVGCGVVVGCVVGVGLGIGVAVGLGVAVGVGSACGPAWMAG